MATRMALTSCGGSSSSVAQFGRAIVNHRRGAFMKAILLILVAVTLAASPASSQEFPPIYVYGEDDDAELEACTVAHARVIAAVEAALRYNRVSVASREAAISSEALQAYVNVNAVELDRLCAVSLSLSLEDWESVRSDVTGRVHRTRVIFCNKATLMTGVKADLQSRANAWVRDSTDACLSEFSAAD